jgi:hypothetical protein
MLDAEYVRRQAEECLRIARTTFDLSTAERLRFMAAELHTKAEALAEQEPFEPRLINGNGSIAGNRGHR